MVLSELSKFCLVDGYAVSFSVPETDVIADVLADPMNWIRLLGAKSTHLGGHVNSSVVEDGELTKEAGLIHHSQHCGRSQAGRGPAE